MSGEVWTDNSRGERRRGGGGGGVNGGSERWRDGGCLRNGGRRLRSNPIN